MPYRHILVCAAIDNEMLGYIHVVKSDSPMDSINGSTGKVRYEEIIVVGCQR